MSDPHRKHHAMRCPVCSYQSPFDVVRCPHCQATFSAGDLEELRHLAYLRDWLVDRRVEGLLPEPLSVELLEEVNRRELIVQTALGLRAPAPAPVAPDILVAQPEQQPVEPAVEPVSTAAVEEVPSAPAGPPAEAAARPGVSWTEIGIYLLSERTLHGLLGLGAFLILASGVVISTLNPTGLGPVLHLAAVLCTTSLFYVAGYVVRQRLRLTLTGAALLAIGGAFIPLSVWTLGQELLHLEPGAIWLAASLLCLPVYVASHALLRDWTFAVLTAVTGGSALLSLGNWTGIPLEWGLVLLVVLGYVYLWLGGRLGERWRTLAQGLAWTAQVAVVVIMLALLGAKFGPGAWEIAARKPLGTWYEYAIGGAWWLGAGFFALAASLLRRSYLRLITVWSVPVAYALTLTKAPWDASWYDAALTVLAGAYVLYGAWRLTGLPRTRPSVLREPVYQAAFVLSLVALFWPPGTTASRFVTMLLLAVVYGVAAVVLRLRLLAYVSIYLLPVACAWLMDLAQLDGTLQPAAWIVLAATLLVAAELEVRRTGEHRRLVVATTFGRGVWQSHFASPLFSAGYAVGVLALGLACVRYWNAPAEAGVRQLDTPTILTFVGLVVLNTLSSVSRRTSAFVSVAAWLFLIPFTATAGRVFAIVGLPLKEAELARLLAILGAGYLVLAFATDRFGVHYSRPLHLVGYTLSLVTMPLSVLDRVINVQVVGLSIVVYAISAWLVHRGRHFAYLDLVRRLLEPTSAGFRHSSALFLYLACWLFPGWLVLAMSLGSPAPGVAVYGIVLTLLAPAYAAVGLVVRRARPEYRWPWYLGGYALSAIGPLVATPDPTLRVIALAVSITLYVSSALVAQRAAWMYVAALLTPVLVWQILDRTSAPTSSYGLVLILLSLTYACLGVVIHHGSSNRRVLLSAIDTSVSAFAEPFFIVGYAVCALGLALVASQAAHLVVLGFALAALLFAGSAFVFRQPLFGYPLAATVAVAYVMAMKLMVPGDHYHGLGLLPGLGGCLAVGEVLRRCLDSGAVPSIPNTRTQFERWAAPFYATTYLGTIAVPAWSTVEQGLWAVAWCAVFAIYAVSSALFRRPAWLYPALIAGLVAYVATAYVFAPHLATADALALLVAPGWLLFGAALATARGLTSGSPPSLEVLFGRGRLLAPAWPDPLAACGWVAVSLAVLGGAVEPVAGLSAAVPAAMLLAVLGTVWRGRAEVWASLVVAAIAFEEVLRLASISALDQPPRWALAALVLSVLAIVLHRRSRPVVAIWPLPLYFSAIAAGAGAMLGALVLQVALGGRGGLQSLSATVALSGLSLVAHGFDRRQRVLGYYGVALLELGYMLQLVFFDVGQPQAFAMPAGLYLMSVAFLEWRRGIGARFKLVVEIAGLTILLGVSLVQAVGFVGAGLDRYPYDTLLLVEGVAVLALGAILHWRRSFFCGAIAIVVDVLVLLADPLRSLNTWYLVAIIGLAMISAVVFIEQRRQRIPLWLNTWRQRLETWD